jgi:ethanolamine transporter EutH
VLVGEVEDEEDVDEEVKLVVAVVGKTGLTELCTVPADVAVAEDEEDDGDTEVTGVLSAVVAVGVSCVAAALVATEGLAPAPMTGWGLKPPIWGAGARFLRKRLWLTW